MIFHTNDYEWDEYINKFPSEKQDIYFSRQYHCLYEQRGVVAELFVYENGNDIGIYPYLKRTIYSSVIRGECYDIESVYGYAGPLCNTDEMSFINDFESAFCMYCSNNNIVAEFVRFHPLIGNDHIFNNNIDVLHNRMTVMLDLQRTEDDIWMNYVSTQNRNTIRRCIKSGLIVKESDNYDAFINIYNETMKRVSAEKFYFFENSYYNGMRSSDNFHLLTVSANDEIVAAAIFMGYGRYLHYHLSGSKQSALKLCPNNILLWEAIKFGKKQGYKTMHLGGGLTDSVNDSLFRFKAKYSNEYKDYFIGKRVHNKYIYDVLINEWESKHGAKAERLLQYRED